MVQGGEGDEVQVQVTNEKGQVMQYKPGMYKTYGRQGGSKLDALSSLYGYWWISKGILPKKYEVLDLTNEQRDAIGKVLAEAKAAYRTHQQETMKLYRQTRDRNVWKEQQEGAKKLAAKFEARITDILTEKQRDLLKKIDELAEKKREADTNIREVANLAYAQNREKHDAELKSLLTPEQLKKLEELTKPKAPAAYKRVIRKRDWQTKPGIDANQREGTEDAF